MQSISMTDLFPNSFKSSVVPSLGLVYNEKKNNRLHRPHLGLTACGLGVVQTINDIGNAGHTIAINENAMNDVVLNRFWST